jgi:sulfatase maturation enzyme AslB (radical SAM superfamily)
VIPSPQQAQRRLAQILRRGSVNLGKGPGIERLMLMLTRSCELRCGYCLVDKQEDAPELSKRDARRGIDLLMRSGSLRLELQLFGGEPTRSWAVLSDAVRYATEHTDLKGRALEICLTTNGVGLTEAYLDFLAAHPVMLLFSLDGDAVAHRRFRPAHLCSDEEAYQRIVRTIGLLKAGEVPWFMNAVLPPAAAGACMDRYTWARDQGVKRLQLNYAVGMRWSQHQMDAYITSLIEVLRHHHAHPDEMLLFNWKSDCEPVMLSDDLIVDVGGEIYHDGAVFLERRFPALKESYCRGHLDGVEDFDPLRWPLSRLYEVMVESYPEGSEERDIVRDNCRFGAAIDLAIHALRRELGRA